MLKPSDFFIYLHCIIVLWLIWSMGLLNHWLTALGSIQSISKAFNLIRYGAWQLGIAYIASRQVSFAAIYLRLQFNIIFHNVDVNGAYANVNNIHYTTCQVFCSVFKIKKKTTSSVAKEIGSHTPWNPTTLYYYFYYKLIGLYQMWNVTGEQSMKKRRNQDESTTIISYE